MRGLKKNLIFSILAFMANLLTAKAGLDWNYGSLSNADNYVRKTSAVAYASDGTVFVTGTEENSLGNVLIVTRKFSSTGTLLASVTNSYFVTAGVTVNDKAKAIATDGSGNVYVLGYQNGSASRANDIVLIKYNASLVQQWKKLIYNASSSQLNYNDQPGSMLIDLTNTIYISGTWSKVTITGFIEEVFVQKYNSSGTLLYATPIPQSMGITIGDPSDMCLDNNSNITVCASTSDIHSVLYARVANTGTLSWKKFYTAPATYRFIGVPEIECTSGGTIYLAASLNRLASPTDNYGRLMTAKLNVSGGKLWEVLTPEVHEYTDALRLRLDASQQIYTGSDFSGPHSGGYLNHRIYKMNSSGTMLWVYTAPETTSFFTFETYQSSSVFILAKKTSPANPMLRKLDATTGTIIWTEDMPFGGIPGYYHSELSPMAISVNGSTGEVAFCGNLIASKIIPVYAEEYRWNIRKYGATSPRLSSEGQPAANPSVSTSLQVYPNPAHQVVAISMEMMEENMQVSVFNMKGQLVQEHLSVHGSGTFSMDVSGLAGGIYLVKVSGATYSETFRLKIQH